MEETSETLESYRDEVTRLHAKIAEAANALHLVHLLADKIEGMDSADLKNLSGKWVAARMYDALAGQETW